MINNLDPVSKDTLMVGVVSNYQKGFGIKAVEVLPLKRRHYGGRPVFFYNGKPYAPVQVFQSDRVGVLLSLADKGLYALGLLAKILFSLLTTHPSPSSM